MGEEREKRFRMRAVRGDCEGRWEKDMTGVRGGEGLGGESEVRGVGVLLSCSTWLPLPLWLSVSLPCPLLPPLLLPPLSVLSNAPVSNAQRDCVVIDLGFDVGVVGASFDAVPLPDAGSGDFELDLDSCPEPEVDLATDTDTESDLALDRLVMGTA